MTDHTVSNSGVAISGQPYRGGRRFLLSAASVAVVAGALQTLGFVIDPKQAAFSYLIGYTFAFSVVMGAMAFILATHTMGATWPTAIRRLPESIMATLPIMALLFIPVLLAADWLYPWVHPERVTNHEAQELLRHKLGYLNLPFATVRMATFFAFWIALGQVLRRWSIALDRPSPSASLPDKLRKLSSGGFFFFGLFATLAAWDWLMSLSPDWFSTMFGLYFLAGGFLGAIALTILLAAGARRAGHLPGIGPSHDYALGRLLFAFLIFWAYTGYFQYMITWIADRPIEVEWFIKRTVGAYAWVAYFLVVGHFLAPFLVLLSYWFKRRSFGLSLVAGWIVVSHYFDVHWIIAAARDRSEPFSWQDPIALLFVVSVASLFGVWRQRGVALAPFFDPKFKSALEYESP